MAVFRLGAGVVPSLSRYDQSFVQSYPLAYVDVWTRDCVSAQVPAAKFVAGHV